MDSELERLARTYVWWEAPERAVERQDLLLCQLMQLGAWDDVRWARGTFGDEAFRAALRHAPPGVLDKKSWTYWNRFYGVVPVPPLPERPLP
jgi:hypothetical protein